MIPLPECWGDRRAPEPLASGLLSLVSGLFEAPLRSPTPCAPALLTPLDPHHFLCSLTFSSALQVSTSPA